MNTIQSVNQSAFVQPSFDNHPFVTCPCEAAKTQPVAEARAEPETEVRTRKIDFGKLGSCYQLGLLVQQERLKSTSQRN